MKMRSNLLLILLMGLLVSYAASASAQTIHMEKMFDANIALNAEIDIPSKVEYSIYDYFLLDLTKSETYNADMLADMFFKDAASKRQYMDERDKDPNGRWGYMAVMNEAGEFLYAYQSGMMFYRAPTYKRYEDAVAAALFHDIYGYDLTKIEGSRNIDLPHMTMEQAAAQCAALLQKISTPLEPIVSQGASFDHIFIGNLFNELCETNESVKQDLAEGRLSRFDDWSEADDVYSFSFTYHLDGIPVNKHFIASVKSTTYMRERVQPSVHTEVYMNRDGAYYIKTEIAQIGDAIETRKVLSYEQAVTRLEEYFGEIIAPYSIEITKGYLMYVPIIDGEDYYRGKLTPTWCFESVGSRDGEIFPDRTYLFDAFTGRELK